ncbi:MAG: DUF420 domain-containing protein [Candidatus Sumerlaeaceae bacterium]|nr:DUF420 domain-containing protein [Candidatus Sumerlaeaceae bacterium]
MAFTPQDIPTLNAVFNLTSATLLLTGYVFIRRGNREAHRFCMVGALVSSALFLTGYLIYHFVYHGMTRFPVEGLPKAVYLTILLTHTVLAVVIVPLVAMTVFRAAKGQFDRHRRVARWTFPLWFYVSITGVVIYVMLYHLYPQPR